MDLVTTLSLALGSAWVSGINLYATVATLGLLGRYAGLELPGELSAVTNGWVIGVAVALYCVEFVADKIPVVDSTWDVALGSHGTKTGIRAFLNLSPEPVTNVVASVTEDVVAVGSILLAVFLPILFLCVLAVAVGMTIWLLPKILRLARRSFQTARGVLARR
jgi:hypothetical protein